jgi:hypothetical protein
MTKSVSPKSVPKKSAPRKAIYRPVQYIVIVGSFVASLLGAAWLQSQDRASAVSATSQSAMIAQAAAGGNVALDSLELKLEPIPTLVAPSASVRVPRPVARSRSSR